MLGWAFKIRKIENENTKIKGKEKQKAINFSWDNLEMKFC